MDESQVTDQGQQPTLDDPDQPEPGQPEPDRPDPLASGESAPDAPQPTTDTETRTGPPAHDLAATTAPTAPTARPGQPEPQAGTPPADHDGRPADHTAGSGSKPRTKPTDRVKRPRLRRRPRLPWKVRWYVIKRTVVEFIRDRCLDLAAGLTFRGLLALFPATVALISLVGVVGEKDETIDLMIQFADRIWAGSGEQIREPLTALASARQFAGFTLVSGVVVALWSASSYVVAFGRAMNQICGVQEGRPYWKLRPIQMIVTLGLVLMVILIVLGLVVSGPVAKAIGDLFGLADLSLTLWSIARWPAILLIVVGMVALLYYATPNVRHPAIRWLSLGALLAIVAWGVLSAGFEFYVTTFDSYNRTYGSLAGVVIFLLWFWLANIALMVGAELDAELERAHELLEGIHAERSLQLPTREDKAYLKREARYEKVVAQGREIRERAEATRAGPGNSR
ncbi:MAG: YhjD/YihY/BrkB family envelope integrity protein [Actinomycetales bacterium]